MLDRFVSKNRRKNRIRAKVAGTAGRPRLAVSSSNKHIVAQLIDDSKGVTLAYASDLNIKAKSPKTELAKLVGTEIAKKAGEKKITEVVFDRGGKLYHGRVKALAEAARSAGLKF